MTNDKFQAEIKEIEQAAKEHAKEIMTASAKSPVEALNQARAEIEQEIENKQIAVNKLTRFTNNDIKIEALQQLYLVQLYQRTLETTLKSPEIVALRKEETGALPLSTPKIATSEDVKNYIQKAQQTQQKFNNLNSFSFDFLKSFFGRTLKEDRLNASLNLAQSENALNLVVGNYNKNMGNGLNIEDRLAIAEIREQSKKNVTNLFSSRSQNLPEVQGIIQEKLEQATAPVLSEQALIPPNPVIDNPPRPSIINQPTSITHSLKKQKSTDKNTNVQKGTTEEEITPTPPKYK